MVQPSSTNGLDTCTICQATVNDAVSSVRSKNAGPFWITIDLFCGSEVNFNHLCQQLHTSQIADALKTPEAHIKRFDISSLNVIKFSVPRPVVQGHRTDRDMHGAQWAVLIAELPIKGSPN